MSAHVTHITVLQARNPPGGYFMPRLLALALLVATGASASLEERFAALEQRFSTLEARSARIESENTELRRQLDEARTTASVSPLGQAAAPGRMLAHDSSDTATCCRWTPTDSCGTVEASLLEKCTHLHEYLEAKTTTHEFADLDHPNCLGATSSTWQWTYDGHKGNVVLSNGGNAVTSFKTPLKVEHAQACSTDAPTLKLQMNTVAEGQLSVGGVDLAAAVKDLYLAGWYLGTAGPTGDCNTACQAAGLVCTESEFYKHIHEVDTCEEVATILFKHYRGGLGVTNWDWSGCSPNNYLGCCQGATTVPGVPFHNTAVNAAFYVANNMDLPSDYNCAAVRDPTNSSPGQPQRLCYCHANSGGASSSSHLPYA